MGRVKRKVKKEKPITQTIGEKNCQEGCIVKLRSVPKIKKAKKLGFTIDSEHKICNPKDNGVNSLMSVYLKGKDGKIYQIQFQDILLRKN